MHPSRTRPESAGRPTAAATLPGLATLALLATGAAAQNAIVSPAGLTNAYGGINNSIPWGSYQSAEQFCQQIHDDVVGQVMVITGMAFRHQYTQAWAARSYDLTMSLGEAATTSVGISSAFPSNWKPNGQKTVAVTGTVNFPAFTIAAAPPAPFDAKVPFQNPVAYVGAAPLMWEVWIRTVTATTPTHYFERGPGGAHTAGAVGTGCTVTGQSGPLTSRGTTNLAQVSETLTNAPAVATRYVTLGFAGNSYGGLPLPVSLAATGSVGCFINIDFRLLLPPTTATTLTAPYPWSVGVAGARFRTQWVVDDQGLIRTSNGLDHSIPYSTAWPVRRVYATSFSTSAPPPSGTVTANGLVTQFY